MSAAPKVYHGVTAPIFDCLKTTSHREHGTVYAPPNADSGTATTTSPGKIVLDFSFVLADQTLSYTLVEKPWWIPESAIWDGIGSTINGCRGSVVAADKHKASASSKS
jgi:hypothetical protein